MNNNKSYSKFRELLLIAFFLSSILFLFFAKSFSPNKVLSPADAVFSTQFFSEQAPTDYIRPSNQILFDQVYQFTPWRYYAWTSLRNRIIPLWNPYSSTGTPFVASMQSAVFFPINLILVAVPFQQNFIWSAILRLFIAGIFTYALCRRYRLEIIPSLISSVSFMLSGFIIVWLGHPHTNVAIWLPGIILLAEILVNSRSNRDLWRSTVLLAIIVAVQFTGGHIETSFDILFSFSIYYLFRWFQIVRKSNLSRKDKLLRLFLYPILSLLIGASLASVQLLPFIEWMPLSAVFHGRSSSSFLLIDPVFIRHLISLPVVIFPNIFNNPTWDYPYWSFLFRWSNYNELILYAGIITLILAIIAAINYRNSHRSLIITWTIIGVISLARSFHFPIIDWFNQFPLIRLGSPERLRLIFAFSICVLSGFGTQILLSQDKDRSLLSRKQFFWFCVIVVFMGLIILFVSNISLPLLKEDIIAYGKRSVDFEFNKRGVHSNPIEYYYSEVDQMVSGLVNAFHPLNLEMYLPAIWAMFGMIVIKIWNKFYQKEKIFLSLIILGLVSIDLFTFGYHYNPTLGSDYFYPQTQVVNAISLDEDLHRIITLQQDLIPDAHMIFGLSTISGLDFPTQWYNQYLNLIPSRIPWIGYGSIFSSADSPLLEALNLKYIVTSRIDLISANRNLKSIKKIGNLYLGELNGFHSRAYMVYNAIYVNNDEEAKQILNRNPTDIFSYIIIANPDNKVIPKIRLEMGDKPTYDIGLIEYEPNKTSWRVYTSHSGFLFIGDSYFPGWNASIDGNPVQLYRANIAFRGIFIPRGEHTVIVKYNPTSFQIGMVLTGSTFILIFVFLVWLIKNP